MEEPFSVSLISGIESFYAQKCYVAFFCRKLLSHSAEDFRRGIFLCFKVFLVWKKLGIREGEAITSFRQFFFSHSTESFLRGTTLCSTKYRITISFMPMSGILGYSKETFLCHSTEKLRRATFLCNHKVCGIEKFDG